MLEASTTNGGKASPPTRIALSGRALGALREVTARRWPREACALLCGVRAQGRLNVDRALVLPNLALGHGRFAVGESDWARTSAQAEEGVAFFHSHSATLWLSPADRRTLESSAIPWVVGCLETSTLLLRAYAFHAGRIEVVPVVLSGGRVKL